MQQIVIEEPYEFVPPIESGFWCWLLRFWLKSYLRQSFEVHSVEVRGAERLKEALDKGQRVMLTPNHCRMSDPLVLGYLSGEVGCELFAMASWHIFKQGWFSRFMARRMGGFSIYREGNDRQALNTAIEILVEGHRPLVIFPEGAISRHNDLLMTVMDGPAFLARQAAKRLAKQTPAREVVILPLAIRYSYMGDVEKALLPEVEAFERRFSWQPQVCLTLVERIARIGQALLGLKEIEYFGAVRQGDVHDRAEALVEELLAGLEEKWKIRERGEGVVARVKNIRATILPDMIAKKVTPEERAARWRDLAVCYYVQQISHYPRGYLRKRQSLPERLVETLERFEEDFTDKARYHGPIHCTISVGQSIPVSTERDRSAKFDPIMQEVARQIQSMLDELVRERSKQLGFACKPQDAETVEVM